MNATDAINDGGEEAARFELLRDLATIPREVCELEKRERERERVIGREKANENTIESKMRIHSIYPPHPSTPKNLRTLLRIASALVLTAAAAKADDGRKFMSASEISVSLTARVGWGWGGEWRRRGRNAQNETRVSTMQRE